MKIVKFTAENIKKLKAVEITPAGNIVEITGPNGSGKSSVLDAIFYALAGAAELPAAVVRQGEERAFVKLDLGGINVTRHFTATGTRLVVESADGARFPSPQAMLDKLIGALSFDPLEFTRLSPGRQLEALRRVVKLDVDVDALDLDTAKEAQDRITIGRNLKSIKSQLEALPIPGTDVPDEPIDITALITKLDDAGKHNTNVERQMSQHREAKHTYDVAQGQAQSLHRQILEFQAQIKSHEIKIAELEAMVPPEAGNFAVIHTSPIQAEIQFAQLMNKAVETKHSVKHLTIEIEKLTTVYNMHTEKVEANEKIKAEAIANAVMPVPGLTFGAGEVLYNGLPLTNASSSEQLRISVAIAMHMNPQLRVLRIKDGSLLDIESLGVLSTMAQEADYQVWLERVEDAYTGTTGGRPCVIMEDGGIKPESKS